MSKLFLTVVIQLPFPFFSLRHTMRGNKCSETIVLVILYILLKFYIIDYVFTSINYYMFKEIMENVQYFWILYLKKNNKKRLKTVDSCFTKTTTSIIQPEYPKKALHGQANLLIYGAF